MAVSFRRLGLLLAAVVSLAMWRSRVDIDVPVVLDTQPSPARRDNSGPPMPVRPAHNSPSQGIGHAALLPSPPPPMTPITPQSAASTVPLASKQSMQASRDEACVPPSVTLSPLDGEWRLNDDPTRPLLFVPASPPLNAVLTRFRAGSAVPRDMFRGRHLVLVGDSVSSANSERLVSRLRCYFSFFILLWLVCV